MKKVGQLVNEAQKYKDTILKLDTLKSSVSSLVGASSTKDVSDQITALVWLLDVICINNIAVDSFSADDNN